MARRDPMVLQRQYFARRREERQQNARRAQVRQSRNSFPPQDRAQADNNNDRTNRTQPPAISTDFLLLANPSAMDSLANDLRLPKRQRIEDKRSYRREHQERLRRDPAEEPDLEVSNDIRIFDAEGEKTQLFRKRTLPSTFLNSQTIAADRRHGRQNTRNCSPDVELNTRNMGNWHRFSKSHLEHNADIPRSRLEPSPTWLQEHDQSIELSRRVRQRRETSPPLPEIDQALRISDPAPRRPRTPDPSYHRDKFSSDRLNRRNLSKRNRSPKSSSFDDRAITSRFDSDEVVEATPSEDEQRGVYKDFLLGVSPSLPNKGKSRIPTAQKLLSTLTNITPHFPPIKIDSDDSETRMHYRSKKTRNKYEFKSLLATEAITFEHFSAGVRQFESTMLNIPDQDVSFLSVSKTVKDRRKPKYALPRNALSDESQLDPNKDSMKKSLAPTFTPSVNAVETDKIPRFYRQPITPPTEAALVRSIDKSNPGNKQSPTLASGSSSPTGMEIALNSESRNPVTLAADVAASEITMKD